MKWTTIVAAVAAFFIFENGAQAREHHHHHRHGLSHNARRSDPARHHFAHRQDSGAGSESYGFSEQPVLGGTVWEANAYPQHSSYRSGLGPRPAAWCGWEMRQLVSSDPGPQYNLARNWAHWGRSGPAGIGAIVVWAHHVGRIVGQELGMWVIESGNDGHRVRTRPRSIAGAIAIRWG
jgi:hypothetical protein